MKNKIWHGFIFFMFFINSNNVPQLKDKNIEKIQNKIQQLIDNSNISINKLIIKLTQKLNLEMSENEEKNIERIENTIINSLSPFDEITRIIQEYNDINEFFYKINEDAIENAKRDKIINEIKKIVNTFNQNSFVFDKNMIITNTFIELQNDPYLTPKQVKELKKIEEHFNIVKETSICNIKEDKLKIIKTKIQEMLKKINEGESSTLNLEKQNIQQFLQEFQTKFIQWKSTIENQKTCNLNKIFQDQEDLNTIKNQSFIKKTAQTMQNLNQKLLNSTSKYDHLKYNLLTYLINEYIPLLSKSIPEQLNHIYQCKEEINNNDIEELDKLFEKNDKTAVEFNLFKQLLNSKNNKECVNKIKNICKYKTLIYNTNSEYTNININENTLAVNFINQISQTYIEEEYNKIEQNENDYLLNYFLNENSKNIKNLEAQISQEKVQEQVQEQVQNINNNRDQHIKILYANQNKLQKENETQQNTINQLQKTKSFNKTLDMIVIGGVITLIICLWIYDTYKTKTVII